VFIINTEKKKILCAQVKPIVSTKHWRYVYIVLWTWTKFLYRRLWIDLFWFRPFIMFI